MHIPVPLYWMVYIVNLATWLSWKTVFCWLGSVQFQTLLCLIGSGNPVSRGEWTLHERAFYWLSNIFLVCEPAISQNWALDTSEAPSTPGSIRSYNSFCVFVLIGSGLAEPVHLLYLISLLKATKQASRTLEMSRSKRYIQSCQLHSFPRCHVEYACPAPIESEDWHIERVITWSSK